MVGQQGRASRARRDGDDAGSVASKTAVAHASKEHCSCINAAAAACSSSCGGCHVVVHRRYQHCCCMLLQVPAAATAVLLCGSDCCCTAACVLAVLLRAPACPRTLGKTQPPPLDVMSITSTVSGVGAAPGYLMGMHLCMQAWAGCRLRCMPGGVGPTGLPCAPAARGALTQPPAAQSPLQLRRSAACACPAELWQGWDRL